MINLNSTQSLTQEYKQQRIIAIWLFICCAVIYAMVILGGVTRLTGSGLSMSEWAPIMGAIPPLNHTEWLAAFETYKQYPEYQLKNNHLNLDGFKSIFWFEFSHRILGRFIGLLFFFPMLFFFLKGWLQSSLKAKLVLMFVLGGLQGLMGWYMVKSGLVNNPHVSQYRLTAHLGLALFVYGYIFWLALNLYFKQQTDSQANSMLANSKKVVLYFIIYLSSLVFITIISGGFVAGLKAGYVYNTFPLMNGKLIPDGLFTAIPLWRNFFENVMTVQFDHRLLATLLFLSVLFFYVMMIKKSLPHRIKIGLHLMLVMLVIQVTLGISTLLLGVPIYLAATHQAGALLLFTIILFVSHQIRSSLNLENAVECYDNN